MKCPLTGYVKVMRGGDTGYDWKECITTECGWFDEHTGVCAVLAGTRVLTAIVNVLGRIYDEYKLDRVTYRCRGCGLTIEGPTGNALELPVYWTMPEQVDGKYIMLCGRCSGK